MMPHWFTSYTKGPFLFKPWLTNSLSGLVAAMMCSIILSILYECMNYVYHVYHLRAERWHTRQNKVVAHVLLSLLRTTSVAVAYIIMLCVMSYNIWILVAVILGAGVGHLVGRPLISAALRKEHKIYEEDTNEPLCDFVDPNEPLKEKKDQMTHDQNRQPLL